MNIIIAIQPSGAKGFPGTSQVVHQTNQVVHTTLKRPSENTGPSVACIRNTKTLVSLASPRANTKLSGTQGGYSANWTTNRATNRATNWAINQASGLQIELRTCELSCEPVNWALQNKLWIVWTQYSACNHSVYTVCTQYFHPYFFASTTGFGTRFFFFLHLNCVALLYDILKTYLINVTFNCAHLI